MNKQRWLEIEYGDSPLTKEEIEEGWHYCYEWDEMCIGPGMPEMDTCLCNLSQTDSKPI